MTDYEIEKIRGIISGMTKEEKEIALNVLLSEIPGSKENYAKPKKADVSPYIKKKYEVYTCPVCYREVYKRENYCKNCGQKLDWGNKDVTRING